MFENLIKANISISFSERLPGEYPVVPPRDPLFQVNSNVLFLMFLRENLTYTRPIFSDDRPYRTGGIDECFENDHQVPGLYCVRGQTSVFMVLLIARNR